MSMFNFFYRSNRDADRHMAPPALGKGDDPFAHPQIASMDLRMLADLPPEQLRDDEWCKRVENSTRAQSPVLRGTMCV